MTGQRVNLFCLIVLIALTGCATYAHNTGAFRNNLAQGNYEDALESLGEARKGANRLLFLLENGLVAHSQGNYRMSNTYFDRAERLADRLFTRSLSREIASLVTNDAVRAYRGEEFELVFIHYYRALNYWYLRSPEDALVECRKANLKLARYAAASKTDPTYRNDAFIHYMTGLFYEATGELNDAYISYQDAAKAYRTCAETFGLQAPPALRDDLLRTARALDYTDGVRVRLASAGQFHLSAPAGDGELVLFSEIGFIPRKIQEELSLPIFEDDIKKSPKRGIRALSKHIARRRRTPYHRHQKVKYWLRVALPAYQDAPPSTRHIRLSASGRTARAVPAQDLSSIARITFQDKQPVILARTVARAMAKYLAAEGIKKKNKVLGFFANLFTASTEAADTRSWVSLPHTVQIGRLHLPPGVHDLTVESLDARGNVIEQKVFSDVRIRPGARTFLNYRTYR